jgi:diadenosine tetraphosphatase ApaH/serine/threonine PP2A family protein phosphatase
LGDLVGYGADPMECLRLSMSWPVALFGNFDAAAISDDDLPGWTAVAAAKSVFWTRSLFGHASDGATLRAYLAGRPHRHEAGGIVYVHGSPRNPLNEYVYPEDIHNARKMGRIAESFVGFCFNGHTHVPGIFVEEGPGAWRCLRPEECGPGYRLDRRKAICNVGSVGQPRDGDWRACYALFDGEVIRFRRVEYDVETTVSKIHANPELDNFLGDILQQGR